MLEREDYAAAAERLVGIVRPTRVIRSGALSDLSGRAVFAKPEHFQRTGSFKIRGAYNFLSLLVARSGPSSVVAASAGNHAQGVALAAALLSCRARIYMPEEASFPKVEATRAYGAEVVVGGGSVDECIAAARLHAEQTGAVFVPPFDDEAIIAGQGTIGLELFEEAPDVRRVLVPIGGGGLISGVAGALAAVGAGAHIIGVEAEGAGSMSAARVAGHVVDLDSLRTMADGIAFRSVSPLTLRYVERYVEEIITVTEEEISRAVLVLLERCKWVVEPAGAVGVAALLVGKIPGTDPVVAIVSGGNIDPLLLMGLIEHGLSAAGRYLELRVLLSDRPGALAALTEVLAGLGLNILTVDHHRSGTNLAIGEVEVRLTLETRDPGHSEEVVSALRSSGFRVDLGT